MKITPLKLPSLQQDDSPRSSIPIIDVPKPIQNQTPEKAATSAKPQLQKKELSPLVTQPKEEPTTNVTSAKEERPTSLLLTETEPRISTTKKVFTNIVPQAIEEINILNAPESIDKDVLQLILDVRTQLQLQIDQNTERLNAVEEKTETFVDKEYVSKFFTKMRIVINETNSSVEQIKASNPEKVTKEDLHKAMEDLYAALSHEESTSGGTTSYRCLLCGRPKTQISGMILDRTVAESLGDPTQSVIAGGSTQRGTILYGTDKQMYKGRGNFGRPTTSKLEDRKLPSLEK